jgi:transitional endoplasmic reticulum ATPase
VRKRPPYLLVAASLLAIYVLACVALLTTKDFDDEGPLSLHEPARGEAALEGAIAPADAAGRCFPKADRDSIKVVGGEVRGRPYYACYNLDGDNGSVRAAKVVDGQGFAVTDAGLIKEAGAWPWIATVDNVTDLVFGAVGLAVILWIGWIYGRRARPGAAQGPWWAQPWVLTVLALTPIVGWIALAALPNVERRRKARAALQAVFIFTGFILFGLLSSSATAGDTWGMVVNALLAGGLVWAVAGSRTLRPVVAAPAPTGPAEGATPPPPARAAGPQSQPPNAPDDPPPFHVQGPADLPTFADVGGMHALKTELKDTFGLMLAFAGEARAYKLRWNGLLLHGPPGVGKSFIARAAAGEFGLNLIHITTADVVSSYAGEAARNLRRAFAFAAARIPCILFFDEFDSIAQRRDDFQNQEARRTVNELLREVEQWRRVPELIVMAATNDLNSLDPAVIRPGRFDRHIRVDLPDAPARAAIFAAALKGRPLVADFDLSELAVKAEGLTPAAIARAVEAASLAAFKESTGSGQVVHLTAAHLKAALEQRGGTDRPTVEDWTWDKLILPAGTKAELQQVVAMVKNPDLARTLGVEPPTGLLLTGPPGTGKTTIAKVLAAQAGCSFYPITGADVTSPWLGESERVIARLFARARENQPSIIFLDEIDAIAGKRGEWGGYDRQINQLLAEIDGVGGQRGVFVLGATNRPDQLDPALLRGGRLSRTIEIPLPDFKGRIALLQLFTAGMPLDRVDVDGLARRTAGYSGADLKALCQQAAVEALTRSSAAVAAADFDAALAKRAGPATDQPEAGRAAGPYI